MMHKNRLILLNQELLTFFSKVNLNIFKINFENIGNHYFCQNPNKKVNIMMLLAIFIKFGIQATTFTYTGKSVNFEAYGTYKFQLWGAQGGGGYINSQIKYQGGKGAYVTGVANFSSKTTLQITVGGQGESAKEHNKGGWPDGGGGGYQWVSNSRYNSAGGGGGSTSVNFLSGTKILVAGGGSGACTLNNGAGGGNFNTILCYDSSISTFKEYSQILKGNSNGKGGDGLSAADGLPPGGGGGGGYYGGDAGWYSYQTDSCGVIS